MLLVVSSFALAISFLLSLTSLLMVAKSFLI